MAEETPKLIPNAANNQTIKNDLQISNRHFLSIIPPFIYPLLIDQAQISEILNNHA
jgi:hypothetical protein